MSSISKIKDKFRFYFSLNHQFRTLETSVGELHRKIDRPFWLNLFAQDRYRQTERLINNRKTAQYKKAFSDPNPLISVRIATYHNVDELIERAIPSVLNQTYKNWEIIVAGDYTTDDTEEKIKRLNHPQIKYVEMSYHYPYPEVQLHRWMAQGLLVHNEAMQHCRGQWIAQLDDDNEMLPYHLEMLLKKAQRGGYEIVYGNMISVDRRTGKSKRVGGFPPQIGNFDFSASLAHRALIDFPFDINSYLFGEVGDVNRMRRFKESSVRIGYINRYVTKYYFRPPGEVRTKKAYPKVKGVYPIMKSNKKTRGTLTYNQADTLHDLLLDTEGNVLLIGEANNKLGAYVSTFYKKKLNLKSSRLMVVGDNKEISGKYEVVIKILKSHK